MHDAAQIDHVEPRHAPVDPRPSPPAARHRPAEGCERIVGVGARPLRGAQGVAAGQERRHAIKTGANTRARACRTSVSAKARVEQISVLMHVSGIDGRQRRSIAPVSE